MVTQLDLADAQFIGFVEGVSSGNILALISAMGLTRIEWEKWKKDYPNILATRLRGRYTDEVDEYFALRRSTSADGKETK